MTSNGVPNKDRAESALSVYHSAMQKYISLILQREYGPDWIINQMLTEEARRRNRKRYQQLQQSLLDGTHSQDLIDLTDIPHLIEGNRDSFDDLRRADIDRMHWIRDLRNGLQHAAHADDCSPSYAEAVVGLCGLVLERCDLADAVERIRRLSSVEPGGVETVATTPNEEHWRRVREPEARGRAKWEQRRAGVLDEARADRALLIYRAAMRRHIQEVLQREFGSDWLHQALESETPGRVRRGVERRLRMLLDLLDQGHDPEEMLDVGDFSVVIRENGQLFPVLQPVDLDKMVSISLLRNKLAHSLDRTPGEDDEIVDLCGLVLERCGLQDAAKDVRRLSLPEFGHNWTAMREWFDAGPERRGRHPEAYAELRRMEAERAELAQLRSDLLDQRRWFNADPERWQRHPDSFEALEQAEERLEAERRELAALGNDWSETRRWFAAAEGRPERHRVVYAELERREQEQHRSPSSAADSKLRRDEAPPKRSLLSRIFRR